MKKKNVLEFVLLVMLALSGGLMDAYSYLVRGNVFATMQTGNMIFFVYRLFQKEFKTAFLIFIPIFAFFLGIVFATVLMEKIKSKRRQAIIFLSIEFLCVLISALLPLNISFYLANIFLCFGSAIQFQAFRLFFKIPILTTMCTGNFRSFSENVTFAFMKKEKKYALQALCYFCEIIIFLMGIALGFALCNYFGQYAILFTLLFLGSGIVLSYLVFNDQKENLNSIE